MFEAVSSLYKSQFLRRSFSCYRCSCSDSLCFVVAARSYRVVLSSISRCSCIFNDSVSLASGAFRCLLRMNARPIGIRLLVHTVLGALFNSLLRLVSIHSSSNSMSMSDWWVRTCELVYVLYSCSEAGRGLEMPAETGSAFLLNSSILLATRE